MKINKTLQTDDGSVHFEGVLSEEEANLVIEVGLGYLMQEGALPFMVNKENLVAGSGELQ